MTFGLQKFILSIIIQHCYVCFVRLSLGSSSVTFEVFVFQVLRFVDSDNLCTGFLLIHLSKTSVFLCTLKLNVHFTQM